METGLVRTRVDGNGVEMGNPARQGRGCVDNQDWDHATAICSLALA